jgi:hypothetical protein
MVLGDDERQLVGPRLAAGRPQPGVLRLDRGDQIVQGVEDRQVVERRGDRQLVVAVRNVRSERAGEVHHPVHVRLVGVEAGVVAVRTVAVGLQDLLCQRQAADDVRPGDHPGISSRRNPTLSVTW